MHIRCRWVCEARDSQAPFCKPKNARNAIELAGSERIDISAMALSGSVTHIPAISAPKDLLTIRRPGREGCGQADT
jgi:hypothetical protein